MNLLALDLSTTTIGWAQFENKELKNVGYISLKKLNKDIYYKLDYSIKQLSNLINQYNIDKIAIESPLLKFSNGKSNAHTINTLVAFNFTISYELYKLGKNIEHINVNMARKKNNISFEKKSSSKQKKEKVRQHCAEKYSFLQWEKKRTGQYKDECYDMADAIIIGGATNE